MFTNSKLGSSVGCTVLHRLTPMPWYTELHNWKVVILWSAKVKGCQCMVRSRVWSRVGSRVWPRVLRLGLKRFEASNSAVVKPWRPQTLSGCFSQNPRKANVNKIIAPLVHIPSMLQTGLSLETFQYPNRYPESAIPYPGNLTSWYTLDNEWHKKRLERDIPRCSTHGTWLSQICKSGWPRKYFKCIPASNCTSCLLWISWNFLLSWCLSHWLCTSLSFQLHASAYLRGGRGGGHILGVYVLTARTNYWRWKPYTQSPGDPIHKVPNSVLQKPWLTKEQNPRKARASCPALNICLCLTQDDGSASRHESEGRAGGEAVCALLGGPGQGWDSGSMLAGILVRTQEWEGDLREGTARFQHPRRRWDPETTLCVGKVYQGEVILVFGFGGWRWPGYRILLQYRFSTRSLGIKVYVVGGNRGGELGMQRTGWAGVFYCSTFNGRLKGGCSANNGARKLLKRFFRGWSWLTILVFQSFQSKVPG